MLNRALLFVPVVCGIALLAPAGCESQYSATGGAANTDDAYIARARTTIQDFKAKDPTMQKFFDQAAGYAVFPKVTMGAAGIGASNGLGGVVFEAGNPIGFSEVSQVTVGAQLGGQSYAEIVFFQKKADLEIFQRGNTNFSANASAVAASSGAGAKNDYSNGVSVFTMPLGGLMFEAAIGGQKFTYRSR